MLLLPKQDRFWSLGLLVSGVWGSQSQSIWITSANRIREHRELGKRVRFRISAGSINLSGEENHAGRNVPLQC